MQTSPIITVGATVIFAVALAAFAAASSALVFGKAQRRTERTRRTVVTESAQQSKSYGRIPDGPARPLKCRGGPFGGQYLLLPYTADRLYIYEWPAGDLHRSPDPGWPPVRFVEPETYVLRGHDPNPHKYAPGPRFVGEYLRSDEPESMLVFHPRERETAAP